MKGRYFVDTNIVVRHLVGDHEPHAKAAAKIFEACDRDELTIVIIPEVLSECVFVLESFYKHQRRNIAAVLKTLISSPGVEIADSAIHLDGLDRYSQFPKMHFVDCMLAAYAASRRQPLFSFDQGFNKVHDIQTVNPSRDHF